MAGLTLLCTSFLTHASQYSIVMMGDPQAWRLNTPNNDPNDDQYSWEQANKKIVESLNKLNSSTPIKFGVINGDITEFGRTQTLYSFEKTYSPLAFKYYIGLGNHDYANNVGDCTGSVGSYDTCAADMVRQMEMKMDTYRSSLSNYNENYVRDYAVDSSTKLSFGSLAYSWDDGDIHYVQLQNYPGYQVNLRVTGYKTTWKYEIAKSTTWLAQDLRQARARGKQIIINFHDGTDHIKDNMSAYEKRFFKRVLTENKVTAIFVGHAHSQYQTSNAELYGDVPVFVADALFNGGYYLVDIDNSGITVKAYNGKDGTPVKQKFEKRVPFPSPPIICKLHGQYGKAGELYTSSLLQNNKEYIFQNRVSKGFLDAKTDGEAYVFLNGGQVNPYNPYQRWKVEIVKTGSTSFDSYYKLTQNSTGKVLDANTKGGTYTGSWNGGNYQQWRIVKTDGGRMLLVNRATGRALEGSGSNLYTHPNPHIFTHNQDWRVIDPNTENPINNVYFYKLKLDGRYDAAFPSNPTQSDSDWEYIGSHALTSVSPCIGW